MGNHSISEKLEDEIIKIHDLKIKNKKLSESKEIIIIGNKTYMCFIKSGHRDNCEGDCCVYTYYDKHGHNYGDTLYNDDIIRIRRRILAKDYFNNQENLN